MFFIDDTPLATTAKTVRLQSDGGEFLDLNLRGIALGKTWRGTPYAEIAYEAPRQPAIGGRILCTNRHYLGHDVLRAASELAQKNRGTLDLSPMGIENARSAARLNRAPGTYAQI